MKTSHTIIVLTAILTLSGCAGKTHEHNLREKIVCEATCTQAGTKELYCTDCDYTEHVSLPSNSNHDFYEKYVTVKRTCTKDGLARYQCSRCHIRETRTLPATHTYEGARCTECGHERELPDLSIGMTKTYVRTMWGEPLDIDKTTSSAGTRETWWYKSQGKTVAVNFDTDGKVMLITRT